MSWHVVEESFGVVSSVEVELWTGGRWDVAVAEEEGGIANLLTCGCFIASQETPRVHAHTPLQACGGSVWVRNNARDRT